MTQKTVPYRYFDKQILEFPALHNVCFPDDINEARTCSACHTYPRATILSDGDIQHTACLCGDARFSATDGYSNHNHSADPSEIVRLFCMDRRGRVHLHVLRDMDLNVPVRQQIREFFSLFSDRYPMILPLDDLSGASPTLVATAKHMAESYYLDLDKGGNIFFHHHYLGFYPCLDEDAYESTKASLIQDRINEAQA